MFHKWICIILVYSKTSVFFKLNYLHFQFLETWAIYYLCILIVVKSDFTVSWQI